MVLGRIHLKIIRLTETVFVNYLAIFVTEMLACRKSLS